MNGPVGFWGWVKILLPLGFAAVFGLSPRAADFAGALRSLGAPRGDPEKIAAVLGYEPWRADALEKLAGIRLASGDPAAAADLLQQGRGDGALTVDGLRLLAAAYRETGQLSREMETDLEILALEPKDRALYLDVVRIQASLGLREEEIQTLDSLLEVFPEDADGLFRRGMLEYAEGDQDGLEKIKKAAGINPFYSTKADLLTTADYRASSAGNPARAFLEKGRGLAAAGEWQLATEVFEQAIQTDPAYADGWAYLGEARQQTGVSNGQEELEKAAALDEDSLAVKGLRALFFRRAGKFEEALSQIAEAAEQAPQEPSWQVEWANTLAESGDLAGALEHYNFANQIDPRNGDNLYLLARFCLAYHMEVRETGLPAARAGAALEPLDPRWPDLLGSIFMTLGDPDLAERSFRQALALDPDYPPAGLHLGQVFLDRGDFENAYPLIKASAGQQTDAASRESAARLLKRYYNEETRP